MTWIGFLPATAFVKNTWLKSNILPETLLIFAPLAMSSKIYNEMEENIGQTVEDL